FAFHSVLKSLLVLEAYMGVTAITTLALAAAIQEQRLAHESFRVAEDEWRRREQRRADEAEAARDQLREVMGMVVHDLRSPLTVTAGYAQLLRRQLASPNATDPEPVLDRIDGSIQTMRRLVADLLDSSRVGAGRFVVALVPTDLVQILTRVVEEQRDADRA